MLPGEHVLRDLEGSLGDARRRLDATAGRLRTAWQAAERARGEEGKEIAALARVRFEELAARRVARDLDEVDAEVLALVERRGAEEARVERDLAACEARRRELEAERVRLRGVRDAALAAYEGRAAATRARLAGTSEWAFQRTRAERAAAQAAHAAAKTAQAERDRVEKGRAYESTKLFRYLWGRRYGFPEYRAGPLVRALDGWVARLCGYDRAHRDYRMLVDLPGRLRAHAERLAAVEAEETAALERSTEAALAQDGVPALLADLRAKDADLARHQEAVDAEEDRQRGLLAQRATLDAGEDAFTRQALAALEAHLREEPVATLRRDALATSVPTDDRLVASIARQRAEVAALEGEISTLRAAQAQALERVREVEDLARRFRHHDFDAADSVFEDALRPRDVFEGLSEGRIPLGEAWTQVRRHQRFVARQRPPFSGGPDIVVTRFPPIGWGGGGSMGGGWRPRGGGGWGGGVGGGGGGLGGGGGGLGGGGGFRTGGGF